MAIIDVVKWDGEGHGTSRNGKRGEEGYGAARNDQLLAWKYPSQELSTWTQLIVNESQEAVLFRGGALDGPFGPGRHVLNTENIPVIGKVLNLPFGRSPFTAEVWFVNKATPLDVPWKTNEPMRVQDPLYNILVPVMSEGQYGVRVAHSRKFLVKLVGTMPEFDREKLRSYLRGFILTIAKTTIAQEIIRKKISVLEISAGLMEISQAIEVELARRLEDFGLELVNFFVSAIDVKEDDKSIETLRGALAKRAEMGIIGYTYQQERSLNALEGAAGFTAAENLLQPAGGGGSPLLAAAIGLGVGMPVGAAIGQQFSQVVAPHLQTAGAGQASACVKCQAQRTNPNAKFCPGCGQPYAAPASCSGCSKPLEPGASFCHFCGAAVGPACAKCSAPLTAGAAFCSNCGTPAGGNREDVSP